MLKDHVRLLNASQALLAASWPDWRILIRLPYGEEADIVVYPLAIRVGDSPANGTRPLIDGAPRWLAAERAEASRLAGQVTSLANHAPISQIGESSGFFLQRIFKGAFETPASDEHRFTLWIGSTGEPYQEDWPLIHDVWLNKTLCERTGPSLYGYFDSAGMFQFSPREQSTLRVQPFLATEITMSCYNEVTVEHVDEDGQSRRESANVEVTPEQVKARLRDNIL